MAKKDAAQQQEAQVERPVTGFVDFRKSNQIVLKTTRIQIIGVLAGDSKKNCWIVKTVPEDGTKGKVLGFFGPRKDGKGVYCSSEVLEICSEKGEKAAMQTVSA